MDRSNRSWYASRLVVLQMDEGLAVLVALALQLGAGPLRPGRSPLRSSTPTISTRNCSGCRNSPPTWPTIAAASRDPAYRCGDFFDRGSSMVPLTRGEAVYGAMALMDTTCASWAITTGVRRCSLAGMIAAYPDTVLGTNLATTRAPLPPISCEGPSRSLAGFDSVSWDHLGHLRQEPQASSELYVLDAREETARAVAELKPKTDLIVAVSHLGLRKMTHELQRECPVDIELARENPDIRVVIGGHTHTLITPPETRKLFDETGSILVQSGDSGKWLGRLTLWVDQDTRRIGRFETEQIDPASWKRTSPEVARYLQEHIRPPHAQREGRAGPVCRAHGVLHSGKLVCDFLREQANADIALLPCKSLDDEHKSFAGGPSRRTALRPYSRAIPGSRTGAGAPTCSSSAVPNRCATASIPSTIKAGRSRATPFTTQA